MGRVSIPRMVGSKGRVWPGALTVALTVLPRVAHSQQQEILAEPELAEPPRWSVALDGYAGLGLLMNSQTEDSQALGGGATRIRLGYFEVGGFAEYADFGAAAGDSHSTHVGGLLGAFLPFHYWADLEGALGVGYRSYVDSRAIFGRGGYKHQTPTLSVRLGVSDRLGQWFGGRLGAQLFGSYDFKRENIPWETDVGTADEPIIRTGSRRVGGFTVGMLMTVGIDIGPYVDAPKRGDRQDSEQVPAGEPSGWQSPGEPLPADQQSAPPSPPVSPEPSAPSPAQAPAESAQPPAGAPSEPEPTGEAPPAAEEPESDEAPAEPSSDEPAPKGRPPSEQPPSAVFPSAD